MQPLEPQQILHADMSTFPGILDLNDGEAPCSRRRTRQKEVGSIAGKPAHGSGRVALDNRPFGSSHQLTNPLLKMGEGLARLAARKRDRRNSGSRLPECIGRPSGMVSCLALWTPFGPPGLSPIFKPVCGVVVARRFIRLHSSWKARSSAATLVVPSFQMP